MFYQSEPLRESQEQREHALIVLTPAESKRLIAKAVAALPEVKRALKKGMVIIANGTTTAFVAEEILGISIEPKVNYALGLISEGELNTNASENKLRPYVLRDGKPVDMALPEALQEFTADDVFIKGANAVDVQGNAGILAVNLAGGTIGNAWPIVMARGSHLIVPVGLEKLIPSVIEASQACSIFRFKYSTGVPATLIPLVAAKVVTEIQAFQMLGKVKATHVASGGVGGAEGSVVLSLEGKPEDLEQAFELVKSIKGEPPVPKPDVTLTPPAAELNYEAARILSHLQASRRAQA